MLLTKILNNRKKISFFHCLILFIIVGISRSRLFSGILLQKKFVCSSSLFRINWNGELDIDRKDWKSFTNNSRSQILPQTISTIIRKNSTTSKEIPEVFDSITSITESDCPLPISNSNSSKKILIIIFGLLRSFQETWPLVEKQLQLKFLQSKCNYEIDLIISTSLTKKNSKKDNLNKFIWNNNFNISSNIIKETYKPYFKFLYIDDIHKGEFRIIWILWAWYFFNHQNLFLKNDLSKNKEEDIQKIIYSEKIKLKKFLSKYSYSFAIRTDAYLIDKPKYLSDGIGQTIKSMEEEHLKKFNFQYICNNHPISINEKEGNIKNELVEKKMMMINGVFYPIKSSSKKIYSPSSKVEQNKNISKMFSQSQKNILQRTQNIMNGFYIISGSGKRQCGFHNRDWDFSFLSCGSGEHFIDYFLLKPIIEKQIIQLMIQKNDMFYNNNTNINEKDDNCSRYWKSCKEKKRIPPKIPKKDFGGSYKAYCGKNIPPPEPCSSFICSSLGNFLNQNKTLGTLDWIQIFSRLRKPYGGVGLR